MAFHVASTLQRRLDLVIAFILGIATVGSAYAAYQAARWVAVQRTLAGRNQRLRFEATRALEDGREKTLYDVGVYLRWLEAKSRGDDKTAEEFRKHFRSEFEPAFEAWLRSSPEDKFPPGGPIRRPEYQLAEKQKAKELDAETDKLSSEIREANETSADFVLTSVAFSTVLFLGGIASRFRGPKLRVAIMILAGLVLILALSMFVILPHTFAF
jgi:hypothetical protein